QTRVHSWPACSAGFPRHGAPGMPRSPTEFRWTTSIGYRWPCGREGHAPHPARPGTRCRRDGGRAAEPPRAGGTRAAGLGQVDQQMADELVVVPDTVKKHVGHILGKLGAANRTQAVARARALGLLR